MPRHRQGFPCCVQSPLPYMPPPNTPAKPVGARVARFPTAGSLPRFNGGSASALCVSRPARRLLALWPVGSLSRPRRPFVIGVLQTMLLPPPSAPIATAWSDSCRAGFAPAEDWRLLTAHVEIHAKRPPGALGSSGSCRGSYGRRRVGGSDGSGLACLRGPQTPIASSPAKKAALGGRWRRFQSEGGPPGPPQPGFEGDGH